MALCAKCFRELSTGNVPDHGDLIPHVMPYSTFADAHAKVLA